MTSQNGMKGTCQGWAPSLSALVRGPLGVWCPVHHRNWLRNASVSGSGWRFQPERASSSHSSFNYSGFVSTIILLFPPVLSEKPH